MLRRLLVGAAAGAAGTTALNATTYLDMALRGRPASSTPEKMVEKLADARGVEIPGEGETRSNRVSALGSLSGLATGVAVGAGYGLVDLLRLRPRGLGGVVLAGGGAMLLANGTMVKYGVTDPTSWTATEWASDVVPHLAYGLVVAATYSALTSGRG